MFAGSSLVGERSLMTRWTGAKRRLRERTTPPRRDARDVVHADAKNQEDDEKAHKLRDTPHRTVSSSHHTLNPTKDGQHTAITLAYFGTMIRPQTR